MKIPFSPPFIDKNVEKEILECLHSGWITSGSKVIELEKEIVKFTNSKSCICVNSWTSGAILMLKWFGVGPGDEVIIPAYTYAATALAVMHCGAKPVLVDVGNDFLMDPQKILENINEHTKVVMPVDIGGWPADYKSIKSILITKKDSFVPNNPIQQQLGRILLLSDAAHSFGASYYGAKNNIDADINIFSFHAVKNLTTAEGGAICLNMPESFDHQNLKVQLKRYSLNGQTKDAFSKTESGNWKYDIVELGFKFNMPDICAAIGLGQIKHFHKISEERKRVFESYELFFKNKSWAILPPKKDLNKETSYHLFMLRINGINEKKRDEIIEAIVAAGVSVNVHFIPLPLLTLFKNLGYDIHDFPNSYNNYSCEITLPVYPQLTKIEVDFVCNLVAEKVEQKLAS